MAKQKKIGYREAVEKIEFIVAELDDDTMDIDVLGDKVQEAAELIALCKKKLQTTEEKVKVVLKDMESFDDVITFEGEDSEEEVPF